MVGRDTVWVGCKQTEGATLFHCVVNYTASYPTLVTVTYFCHCACSHAARQHDSLRLSSCTTIMAVSASAPKRCVFTSSSPVTYNNEGHVGRRPGRLWKGQEYGGIRWVCVWYVCPDWQVDSWPSHLSFTRVFTWCKRFDFLPPYNETSVSR